MSSQSIILLRGNGAAMGGIVDRRGCYLGATLLSVTYSKTSILLLSPAFFCLG